MAATNSSLPDPQASSPPSTLIPGGSSLQSGYDAYPRLVSVDDSTGCTLTKASIKGLTPKEFEDLSNKETDLARVIASAAEAKMLGVEERGLTALLTSSIQNIKPLINKVNVAEQSIILPYIQRRQRSVINANYFAISAGQAADSSSQYAGSYPTFPSSGLAAGTRCTTSTHCRINIRPSVSRQECPSFRFTAEKERR